MKVLLAFGLAVICLGCTHQGTAPAPAAPKTTGPEHWVVIAKYTPEPEPPASIVCKGHKGGQLLGDGGGEALAICNDGWREEIKLEPYSPRAGKRQ